MDSVIKVRRSFLNELRGFCRRFTSVCDNCFHRPCDCPMADTISLAKTLITRIDTIRDAEEERFFIENPQMEKFSRIIKALEQAGRPVLACEIRLNEKGKYQRQKKHQLLSLMLNRGMITTFVKNNQRFYSLPQGKSTNNNKHKKDKQNGIQS